MEPQQRLIGIDAFRVLAIYAVIIVHIDEGIKNIPPGWFNIINFASFCVPFFLATAFYLAISKLYASQKTYPLRSRLTRLLIPYGFWSIFYLLYKAAKYLVVGETSRLVELLRDPLSLIFLGGVSFHLYFLPLLATGTLLLKLVEILVKIKFSLRAITFIALISLLIHEMVLVSGNGLKAPANVAFESFLSAVSPEANSNPLLRWFFVELVWVLRCLPYIMFGMIFAHPMANKFLMKLTSHHSVLCIGAFLSINILGTLILPQAVDEIARGYSSLIAAISLSNVLRISTLIKSISLCSFGIYLIHIIFVEILQSIAARSYPDYVNHVSSLTLLAAATLVFLTSWAITFLLMKNKKISQVLYGT